jgi:predicted nucleotidyltransferase component of viral defense system
VPPSRELLRSLAATSGHHPDVLEKVLRLIELIGEIDHHPLLTRVLALKGGTALNLFHLSLPRISVDLDFNYIGQGDRDQMLAERTSVEGAIEAVVRSLGYPTIRAGFEDAHAGARWELPYTETGGSSDHLEISVSWIHRVPLLGTVRRLVHPLHPGYTTEAELLSLEEIYAGKVAALLDRAHPRDLYDVTQILGILGSLRHDSARQAALFYLALSSDDPGTRGLSNVLTISDQSIRRYLYPLLRRGEVPSKDSLVTMVTPHLEVLLDLSKQEEAFFEAVARGESQTALLFPDPEIAARADASPALNWKLLNVREHLAGRRPPAGRRRGRRTRRQP